MICQRCNARQADECYRCMGTGNEPVLPEPMRPTVNLLEPERLSIRVAFLQWLTNRLIVRRENQRAALNMGCAAWGCDRTFGVVFGDPFDETDSQVTLCAYHVQKVYEHRRGQIEHAHTD